jgi:hypothetical protein
MLNSAAHNAFRRDRPREHHCFFWIASPTPRSSAVRRYLISIAAKATPEWTLISDRQSVPAFTVRTYSYPATIAVSLDGRYIVLLNQGYRMEQIKLRERIAIVDLSNNLTRIPRRES